MLFRSKECRLKKEYFRNGEYVDVERMCLFESQWRRLKARLNEVVGFESPELKVRIPPRRKQPIVYKAAEPTPVAAPAAPAAAPRTEPSGVAAVK